MLQWRIPKDSNYPRPRTHPSVAFQEVQGVRYYLCGNYYQRAGQRLHRVVWAATHGPIPMDFHVHHQNGDRTDNRLENLELLSRHAHLSIPSTERGKTWKPTAAAIAGCQRWHASPAGRAWHLENYQKNAHHLHKRGTFTCIQCGTVYEGQVNSKNAYCSPKCNAAHRRASGVDNQERMCARCGAGFMVNRYSKQRHCSRSCAKSGPRHRTSWTT